MHFAPPARSRRHPSGCGRDQRGPGLDSGALLDREAELAAVAPLLAAAAAGDGGAAIVSGPAGIGKTRLLEAAVEEAEAAGLRALAARANELEADFPFGVVRQLVEAPVLELDGAERAELLAGAARHAAAVLQLDAVDAPDRYAAIHGLYWLVANLASRSPLLLAVDDAQFADEPSLRFIAYLLQRLERLPVAVVLAVRDDRRAQAPTALDFLEAEPNVVRVRPGPLSAAAVAELLGSALGVRPDPRFAEACRARSGGNPFFVAELVRELSEADVRPTSDHVGDVERLVPERVGQAVGGRLERLSPRARAVARALVVLGGEADVPVAAALAGLSADDAARAAGELAAAGLVDVSDRIRFGHPLLQDAAAAELPPAEVGREHGRAARLLAEYGAPERHVVAHLLASTGGDGDAWAVERLRAAARSARAQGAAEQAVAELQRALSEPPPGALRGQVLRELGSAELAAMDVEAAEHLRAAIAETQEPGARADIALELAVALGYEGRDSEAIDVLLDARAELGEDPAYRERALLIEGYLGLVGQTQAGSEPRTRGRLQSLAAGLTGETAGERFVRAAAALESSGEDAATFARAASLVEAVVSEQPWLPPVEDGAIVAMYLHAERPDAAGALTDRLLTDAREAGSPPRHAVAVGARGIVAADVGALRAAEADLRECVTTLAGIGLAPVEVALGFLVQVLAERGAIGDAQALLTQYGVEHELPEQMIMNPLLFGLGTLEASRGRFDAAADAFLELGRRHEGWKIRRPSPPWRSSAALAFLGLGDRERAQELADEAVEVARAWGTTKAMAVALRTRAMLDEGAARLSTLVEVVALLDGTPWRLEAARARCDLGTALRVAGRRREAREALASALDEAHTCGAEPLATRAADELRATGARPRRRALQGVESLTPSEARVAELAAAGRTNREVAQDLFVSLATVETHLTRVYRKLGVAGRAELGDSLSQPPTAAPGRRRRLQEAPRAPPGRRASSRARTGSKLVSASWPSPRNVSRRALPRSAASRPAQANGVHGSYVMPTRSAGVAFFEWLNGPRKASRGRFGSSPIGSSL